MIAKQTGGIAYLVGAGPGDPGLITVRGAKLLESADVVVYDALANAKLLSYCPQAELIYVGKRAATHSMMQAEINAVLVEKTAAGKRVVRLKGGDPFIFGRGGEECEALRAAGLSFEVVPGITAAVAAPAYAGIPVTHRDFNSSFTLITGHEKEEEYKDDAAKARGAATGSSDLDWGSIAKLPCKAFYMGAKALPRICARLIEHGQDPATPAATIQWGTLPNQHTVVGTVGDLPGKVAEAKIGAPAITIIGKVVSMRETCTWFENRPLFGKTIVVTRTRQQASELSERLEGLGANVIEAPTIDITPPSDWSTVDAALRESFDWIVFTSANGVSYAKRRMFELELDARAFAGAKIAAIGDATARAVRDQLCLNVDLCPPKFVADALADALVEGGHVEGKRFALLRAEIARPILVERLNAAGAAVVRDVAVYETREVATLPEEFVQALAEHRVNWVTFSSSSTVRNFVKLLGADYRDKLKGVSLASIGPITSQTMHELGIAPTVEAANADIAALVDTIAR